MILLQLFLSDCLVCLEKLVDSSNISLIVHLYSTVHGLLLAVQLCLHNSIQQCWEIERVYVDHPLPYIFIILVSSVLPAI